MGLNVCTSSYVCGCAGAFSNFPFHAETVRVHVCACKCFDFLVNTVERRKQHGNVTYRATDGFTHENW